VAVASRLHGEPQDMDARVAWDPQKSDRVRVLRVITAEVGAQPAIFASARRVRLSCVGSGLALLAYAKLKLCSNPIVS
jgi:hypothetical protein